MQLARGQLASSRNFPICNNLKNTSTPLGNFQTFQPKTFQSEFHQRAPKLHIKCTQSALKVVPMPWGDFGGLMPPKHRCKPHKFRYETLEIGGVLSFSECQSPCTNATPPFEDFLATVLKHNCTCT